MIIGVEWNKARSSQINHNVIDRLIRRFHQSVRFVSTYRSATITSVRDIDQQTDTT
ncbi:hypothetical protein KSF78_0003056 [Schistosoma japonicum]|nr:hypothetical protein KSF78_0003056 [Schistosoma japonicum]KAH8864809.1 hypothetical protein KSF78_0003056 [Schistosoma japonicum]KAH8864810.1 hypothetical protein KSF78_0003056 [Schistosoma japonicum]